MMKLKIKNLWVAALMSGKYKQGYGQLKDKNRGYCCLGVLTDLYCKEKKIDWKEATKNESTLLPKKVMSWAGLENNSPTVDLGEGIPVSLAHLNDSRNEEGLNFRAIATRIRNYL